jgi:hypothetical protein
MLTVATLVLAPSPRAPPTMGPSGEEGGGKEYGETALACL